MLSSQSCRHDQEICGVSDPLLSSLPVILAVVDCEDARFYATFLILLILVILHNLGEQRALLRGQRLGDHDFLDGIPR